MLDIPKLLAQELSLKPFQVTNALDLFAEGATVPFIARYRKERTGELNETQLRELSDRHTYLTELEDRKQTVVRAIAEQGKLTDILQRQIEQTLLKTELEDLYLPYRPKRRTRATIARERGLEPLAQWMESLNQPQAPHADLEDEAARYLDEENGVKSPQDALQGASDILAEGVADWAEVRSHLRQFLLKSGCFTSSIKAKFPEGTTKYEMYRNYTSGVTSIQPHNLLALLRGEKEGVLSVELVFDDAEVQSYLEGKVLRAKAKPVRAFYQAMLRDAFNRLMRASLTGEVIAEKKRWADVESITTFESNLRELLLSPPAGMKPTLAIDPGFRTGCKVAVIDQTGQFLEYQAIFPHTGAGQRQKAAQTLAHLIQTYGISLIAIGNGTASRETDAFVGEVVQPLATQPITVIVNESGASIYSASEVAIAEFPDLDITVRGAISIGRRLQDPLAELVKIDPKALGVGQDQHDVDQKLLKKKLDETVESCVNYVGVDLNTASKELLSYVSGISASVANNIVQYRNQNGAFGDRRELKKVAKLGPKAYEQAAGFLRIRNGKNPLDNTAVHPESYKVVEAIAHDLHLSLHQIHQINPANESADTPLKSIDLKRIDLARYVTDTIGEPTLRDILAELEKPGRDPRAQFAYATFRDDIQDMRDLKTGMILEGIVTNVANFGAFVDVGVHQDGLVHVSQLADRFVKDPKEIVKVGQIVTVRVLEVNESLKRISLSMRSDSAGTPAPNTAPSTSQPNTSLPSSTQAQPQQSAKLDKPATSAPSLEDLKARFNRGKR